MELKMKQKVMVTPAKPTWKGNQSLSVWEQIGCTTYLSITYFYSPNTTPFETITQTLIDSLSHTLLHFYPLAGRLRSLDNGGFQLECNEDGVVFVAAELNTDLSYFEKDYFTPTPETNRFLLPYSNESLPIHERPILLVQLTKLSCGGLSIGITISHALVDGVSIGNFMTEWAGLTRGLPLQKAPFFDKKAFGVGNRCVGNPQLFDHSNNFCNKMPFLLKQPDTAAAAAATVFTLKLTKEQVQKLKHKANNNDLDRRSRPYTCFEALTAHIWRCSIKARKNLSEQVTACLMSIDPRQRLEPPLPFSYFGRASFEAMASCEAGELLSKPLSYGVSKVRSVIEMVTNDYIMSATEFLKSQQDLTKFQYCNVTTSSNGGGGRNWGNPNICVTSWLNLPYQGIDFGWGKEIHFGPAYEEFDGGFVIIRKMNNNNNNNNDADDHSVFVFGGLLLQHVQPFKNYFYHDI
ncbi:hypothetical protein F8388_024515 [Cannabis sativa]|uniref:Uncharacterized protein n=1 Tax=Cannabis sativa TaxID=3483 RepID=A0A7J6GBP1_CANSA|nr:hypothetical protein F8388_024515 [Cannabis sativa]